MKRIFDVLCVPLMLINDNIYTFISGILLSLSTGTITTLCLEKLSFSSSWHLYVSSLLYAIVAAMLIYITSQVSDYQHYIAKQENITRAEKIEIVDEHEEDRYTFWFVFFFSLFALTIAGTALLFLNYLI